MIDPSAAALARELGELRREVETLKRGQRAAQLNKSSIEDGSLNVYSNGVLRTSIGLQEDGNYAVAVQNASPPPRPNTPDVVNFQHGLAINWNGEFVTGRRPSDFKHLEVYLGSTTTFIPGPSNFQGTLGEAGGLPIAPLDPGSTYYALFIAVNASEKEVGTGVRATASEPSLVASGTPEAVVAASVLAGVVDDVALATNAVTRIKIAALAIDKTKISDLSIESRMILANAVQAAHIAAEQIQAGHIVAAAITAEKIAALAIQADKIAANAINAGHISAGAVTAAKLVADLVLATRIIVGTMTGNRVELHPKLGLQAYADNGATRTFWLDAATGAAFFMGEIATAPAGTRIVLNPGGSAMDEQRFYQGNVYGYMMAEPAPNGTAAISMNGSGTNRGKVVAYPGEGAVSYAQPTLSQSAASCVSNAIYIWGGLVSIENQARWGVGFTDFTSRNSSGATINSRTLRLKGAGSGEPALLSPNFDTQMVWTAQGIVLQDDSGTQGRQIIASNVAASSRRVKKGERPIVFKDGKKAGDIIDAVTPKAWNYEYEWVKGEPEPPKKKYVMKGQVKRDENGRPITDPVTEEPLYEPDTEHEVEHAEPIGPHYGLMAEEVEAVVPEIVQSIPEAIGGKGLSDRDMLAIMWLGMQEMRAFLKTKGM